MSVLIKGMEMPEDGETVTLTICADGLVFEEFKEPGDVFHAVPVPPHGRLIDVRRIESENNWFFDMSRASEEFDEHASTYAYSLIANIVANAPTVIPEEEGE